jgi:FAR-17a/AIG1-like protein.
VIPEDLFIPLHAGTSVKSISWEAPNNTIIDISFHAAPSVVMLIDLLLLSPPWTITVLPALGLSSTIAFGYWFWIEQCFSQNGWFVYDLVFPTSLAN